jgi:hypothetical protein
MLAVVDAKKRFTDVTIGYTGKVGDMRIFKNSSIGNK